jgi:hypothetical protein
MAKMKLAKLPDRTPAKITISVGPELAQGLHDYAALYQATYGERESVAELIPFMLEAFLEGDRAFARARKTVAAARPADSSGRSSNSGGRQLGQGEERSLEDGEPS